MILTIEEQSYDRFYIVQSYIVLCRFHIFSTFSSFIQLTQFLKYDFLPHWKIFPDMNVIKIYELKKKSPYHKILIFILLLRNVLMKYTCLLFFWCNVFHLSFFFRISCFLFSIQMHNYSEPPSDWESMSGTSILVSYLLIFTVHLNLILNFGYEFRLKLIHLGGIKALSYVCLGSWHFRLGRFRHMSSRIRERKGSIIWITDSWIRQATRWSSFTAKRYHYVFASLLW